MNDSSKPTPATLLRSPYVAVPVLTIVWWLAMWFSSGYPEEILQGRFTEFKLNDPIAANALFVIVTATSIALYFWLLTTHRGQAERILYALLWPALTVAVYLFILLLISEKWSGGVRGSIGNAAIVSGLYGPLFLFMKSWPSVAIGLAATLSLTEPYAKKIQQKRLIDGGFVDPLPASS